MSKNLQESILTHFFPHQISFSEVRFARISAERYSISIGTISVRFTSPWGYHADSFRFFFVSRFCHHLVEQRKFRVTKITVGKKKQLPFTRNSREFSNRKKQKTFSFQCFFQISKLWDIPPQPVVWNKNRWTKQRKLGVGGYARIGGHQQKCWKWLGTPSFSWVKLKFLVFFV